MSSTFPLVPERTKNPGQSVREPPLRLAGFTGADRYAPITDTHADYPLARFAWHHGPRLDGAAKRALFAVLLASWPRTRGQHAATFDDDRAAAAAMSGASHHEIAQAWCIEPNSAAKKARRGAPKGVPAGYDPSNGTTTVMPSIKVVTGDQAAFLLHRETELLPEPRDPADVLDELLPVDRPQPEQWAEGRRRLAAALAPGLPEQVTVSIVPFKGEKTVVEIPTNSAEAAWRAINAVGEQAGSLAGFMLTDADPRVLGWLAAVYRP